MKLRKDTTKDDLLTIASHIFICGMGAALIMLAAAYFLEFDAIIAAVMSPLVAAGLATSLASLLAAALGFLLWLIPEDFSVRGYLKDLRRKIADFYLDREEK